MAFQKIQGTRIFDGYRFQDTTNVLVLDEQGTVVEMVPASEAGSDVRQVAGIISPGFINCHCHLELSHMKGKIAEGTGLVGFVSQVMQQRFFAEEVIVAAIEEAENELLQHGVVAVGDICNTAHTLDQKKKGRIYYHNFIELSGTNPAVANQRFQTGLEVFNRFAKEYSIPVESNSLVPHAPYSVSKPLWSLIQSFPGNHLLTMHNQETPAEDELFRQGTGAFLDLYRAIGFDPALFQPTGTSSLASVAGNFLNNQSVILVHNVCTTASDMQVAATASANFTWCLCPNANQYISQQLPDMTLFENMDEGVVLGTDSLASNHQLSILSEILTLRAQYQHLSLERLLRWATSNGAKALQLDSLLGSFEPGKKPGVLLLHDDLSEIHRLY